MKQTLWLALAGALLGSTGLAGCTQSPETSELPPARPVRVRIVPVQRGDISDVLTVSGETAALSTLRLASPVTGRITALTVRAGDRLARDEVAAQVISFENEAAVRGFALLDAATQLTPEERQLAQRLRRDVGTRSVPLRVPFAAVVAERLHNPGELVTQNDVLLEIFDPSSLYVIAQVPADVAAHVHSGAPAEVDVAQQRLHGRVTALITALTPQTLTVPVRITLDTAPEPAFLHAAVRCRIGLAHDPRALIVPSSALVSSGVGQHGAVIVATDGHARRRTVELGIRSQSRVEVVNGLSEGEQVLADGQYALPDGTPIEAAQGPSE